MRAKRGYALLFVLPIMAVTAALSAAVFSASYYATQTVRAEKTRFDEKIAVMQIAAYFEGEYIYASDKSESGAAFLRMSAACKEADLTISVRADVNADGSEVYTLFVGDMSGKTVLTVKAAQTILNGKTEFITEYKWF